MNNRVKPYLLLFPAAMVLFGILASGIITALFESFGYMPVVGLREITLKYYINIFSNNNFISSLRFSLSTSLISSLIAATGGVTLAYAMLLSQKGRNFEKLLYKVPIIVPHMVAALLMFNILSQGGVLPRLLYHLHIINAQREFPLLVFDKYGVGIIITYLWKEIPFVAMVVYTFFNNINKSLEEAALNLGASKNQYFWNVLLPLSWPSVFSSFIIIFAFSFGAFEVPYLLGPTWPRTLPVQAFIEYSNPDIFNRPNAMAVNVILILISVILVWIYDKALGRICRN